ncbi:hypothetical protein D770_04875 [Flammeovirgaceae bacterium 311]|nr:hypothetical protein D770_04875 [Flammeovirgaceae bacterium 311]
MSGSHIIVYGVLLLLVVSKAIASLYHLYDYSSWGFDLRIGMLIEPILLLIMVLGLIIRKYTGWILALLLPSIILIYTIANLLGLVDFWGIIEIQYFIFYYVLLITLNIKKVRQVFDIESTKIALRGNLTTISLSIIFLSY